MSEISELMGISFGKADIYRRALEKMHKPANKKKVEYFKENCVNLAVKRGIPILRDYIENMLDASNMEVTEVKKERTYTNRNRWSN